MSPSGTAGLRDPVPQIYVPSWAGRNISISLLPPKASDLCTRPSVLTQPLWPGAGIGFSNNSLVGLLSGLKKQKPTQEKLIQRHYRLFMREHNTASALGEVWCGRKALWVGRLGYLASAWLWPAMHMPNTDTASFLLPAPPAKASHESPLL